MSKVILCKVRGRTKRYLSYAKAMTYEDKLIAAIDKKRKKK